MAVTSYSEIIELRTLLVDEIASELGKAAQRNPAFYLLVEERIQTILQAGIDVDDVLSEQSKWKNK